MFKKSESEKREATAQAELTAAETNVKRLEVELRDAKIDHANKLAKCQAFHYQRQGLAQQAAEAERLAQRAKRAAEYKVRLGEPFDVELRRLHAERDRHRGEGNPLAVNAIDKLIEKAKERREYAVA